MLPESCLERAITDCLYSLNVSGNLELVEMVVASLLNKIKGHETLKAEAAAISVQVAVKSRNIPLAVRRFEKITEIGESAAIINFKADALEHLAAGLLPDNPTSLMRLWDEFLSYKLPVHAQHILAHIGIMLVRQFLRNQDKNDANVICQCLRNHIDISLLGNDFLVLEKRLGL